MRVCISGAQNTGKGTFIQDFLANWPMYKSSGETYRDIIKEKKLKINKKGTEENQELILNCLLDEAMKYTRTDNVIHDRGVMDNLVYTLWLVSNKKNKISDDFVKKSFALFKQAMNFYDIIFYIPYDGTISLDSTKKTRETDVKYIKSIDSIFKALIARWHNGDKSIYPFDEGGCGAIIDIYGDRQTRIEIAKMYINPEGGYFGEKDSLITGEEVNKMSEMLAKAKIDKKLDK